MKRIHLLSKLRQRLLLPRLLLQAIKVVGTTVILARAITTAAETAVQTTVETRLMAVGMGMEMPGRTPTTQAPQLTTVPIPHRQEERARAEARPSPIRARR
jgi:hypothetical protein